MENVQDSTRVYSVDRKIWTGMQTKDANTTEDDMKLFNFADQDGNGEIDDKELARYNGPLLVENFPENTARIIGHAGPLSMNGLILSNNEVDYYPGLRLEQVDKAGRVVFNQIDTDHDCVLSKEEMEAVVNAKQKMDTCEEKLNEINYTKGNLNVLGGCAAALSVLIGGLASNAKGLGEFCGSIFSKTNGGAARLSVGLGLLFGGLIAINCKVAKNKAKKELENLQDSNHPYTNEKIEELKNIV